MKSYTNGEMERWIDDHIHSKRNRIILKLHYIDGMSADDHGDYIDSLHELMGRAPDESTRQSIQRMIQQAEQGQ